MDKRINVLSLCDGMSCGQIALKELGIKVNKYYASEIDKNAIKVTMDNFPNTIQLGDVMNLIEGESEDGEIFVNKTELSKLPRIDLVIFGSPCRSLSKATAGREKYNSGLNGVSGLFYYCNAVLQWVKKNNNENVYFMCENVDSNNKKDLDHMSQLLGVEYITINSNLFSAQDRVRNYWTNIPIKISELPKSNPLVLNDIMDDAVDEKFFYNQSFDFKGEDHKVCAILHINGHDILKRVNSRYFKSPTLTSCRGGNLQKKVYDNGRCRKLTPSEYRKLQTIPDWYIMNVANSHIYNMCGDGWTVEVIKYLFSYIK